MRYLSVKAYRQVPSLISWTTDSTNRWLWNWMATSGWQFRIPAGQKPKQQRLRTTISYLFARDPSWYALSNKHDIQECSRKHVWPVIAGCGANVPTHSPPKTCRQPVDRFQAQANAWHSDVLQAKRAR